MVYIDDISLWGKLSEVDRLWARTLAVLRALTCAGFMINIRKSKLLSRRASIVGMNVRDGLYWPIDKPLRKLFGEEPPRDLTSL